MFANTLQIDFNRCPPDCSACQQACFRLRDGQALGEGRIQAVHLPQVSFQGALSCIQCGQPRCLEVCPTGAISKSPQTGTVKIAEEKCVGCALCSLACPYGGVYYSTERKKAFKCDLCDGQPLCLEACPYGVLSFVDNRPLEAYLRHEDLVPQGTSLCYGCPAELAVRFTLRVLGVEDTVFFTAPGCAAGALATGSAPTQACLLDNVAAQMTGVKRYYQKKGRDIKVVAFVGDGATVDIGFGPLSGAAERGENLIYICYDNEAYMNTGVQRSGSTPFGAWTTTTPVGKIRKGKDQPGKYMPLLMALHNIPYAATASTSHLEDYARKLVKAAQVKDGLAYIHLFSPCPTGWRAGTNTTIEICRKAVETNYFPLWEAERGEFRLTYEAKRPLPVPEFTRLMGRFRHLTGEALEDFQRMVDERYRFIRSLVKATSAAGGG